MKHLWKWLISAVIALVSAGAVSAQTVMLTVNGTTGTITTASACPTPRASAVYKQVQAAINCAASGDVILIAAGNYNENLVIGKNLTLIGAGAGTTLLNGGAAGRVITIGIGYTVRLSALTVTNGAAADGAGIFNDASTLALDRVTVTGNTSTAHGGGIFSAAGTIELSRSSVTSNLALNGGGIYTAAGSIDVYGGAVTGNNASAAGGGIYTLGGTLRTIPIVGNSATQGAQVQSIVGAVITLSDSAFLDAAITLQGRPAAPNTQVIVPLAVTVVPSGGGTPVFDGTVSTDVSSSFSLRLPPGAYRMRVRMGNTLARVVSVTLAAGDNAVPVPALLTGDANGDNVINITDFSILAASFGRAFGTAGYDARADFNGDSVVNISDFSLLAGNFGRAGETV